MGRIVANMPVCLIAAGLFAMQLLFGCTPSGVRPESSSCRKVEGIRIAWDHSTLRRISTIGDYPRLRRLGEERHAVVYENGHGDCVIRYSRDGGLEWSEPDTLFHSFRVDPEGENALVWISNPELIRLSSGEMLAACNYRPQKQGVYPFSIVVRRSLDGGENWSPPQTVYRAGKSFGDGCWEPSFLELPNGEVHIYFSDEGTFTQSDEQDIKVLISHDKGASWCDPQRVCFRAGKRDGMPVACLAGEEILVSVEDNRVGQFKPSIVRNPAGDPWREFVSGDSPLREYALLEPLHDTVYAGAPYIMTIPSGEVLLSYQTTRERTADWELSTMEVAVGSVSGRDFTKITRPFDVSLDKLAKWNSLALWDENTVAALSGCNYMGGRQAACMILGHIIGDPVVCKRKIEADGRFRTGEWSGEPGLFVGHKGDANVRMRVCRHGKTLYMGADVSDMRTEVCFYLASRKGSYKISHLPGGTVRTYREEAGDWAECVIHGITVGTAPKSDAPGYIVEIGVPYRSMGLSVGVAGRINLSLKTTDPNTGEHYCELAANTSEFDTATWFELKYYQK